MNDRNGAKNGARLAPATGTPQGPISGLARATLLQKLGGYVNTQLIYLFAHLGVADQLVAGHCNRVALAAALDIDALLLYRLLRGWISVGLLTEGENDDFVATPLAQLLVADRPDSLRDYALLAGEEWYPAWDGLSHLLEGDGTPFAQVFGTDYYTHFAQKPDAGARFNRFMEMRTVQTVQALLESYDFLRPRFSLTLAVAMAHCFTRSWSRTHSYRASYLTSPPRWKLPSNAPNSRNSAHAVNTLAAISFRICHRRVIPTSCPRSCTTGMTRRVNSFYATVANGLRHRGGCS